MQHYKIKTSDWLCAAIPFFVSSAVHASIPPINIILSSGTNIIAIGPGETATVEYLIQDVIGRPPARTWLWSTPIPAYMSRTASINQPDCSVYNQNPAIPQSFVLPPNGSCYFAMEVNGTALATQATPTSYKPIFSNSGAIAYGPCDALQLTSTTTPPPPPPPVLQSPLVAAGLYREDIDGGTRRPLLVSSRDLGNTWIYPNAIPSAPPPFANDGAINGTSCTGTTCIAAGKGEDAFDNSFALLAVSQDSALTWNYDTSAITPVFSPLNSHPYGTDGLLTSASCSSNICIAGGQYRENISLTLRPFLAVSLNNGNFWIYPESITEPVFTPINSNPYLDDGLFNSVSCSSPLCIATGFYTDGNFVRRPLLAMSQDAGLNWTYPNSITDVSFTPIDPNPFGLEGHFNSASCSGNTCVTVGSYIDQVNTTRPMLAFTNDAGNTWTYPVSVTNPLIIPAFISGTFFGGSCSGSNCVAVGSYSDILGFSHPLLAQSQDAGMTWNFPANIPVPTFSNAFVSGYFNSTSCSGNICIAAGTYTDINGIIRPLLALSRDGGVIWTYPEEITTPIFTPPNSYPFGDRGQFIAASCDGNICIASGSYILPNSLAGTRPLLALTIDGGITWTYPGSISDPVFSPTNTYPFGTGGVFFSATTSNSSFLPKRLKFLYLKS